MNLQNSKNAALAIVSIVAIAGIGLLMLNSALISATIGAVIAQESEPYADYYHGFEYKRNEYRQTPWKNENLAQSEPCSLDERIVMIPPEVCEEDGGFVLTGESTFKESVRKHTNPEQDTLTYEEARKRAKINELEKKFE